MCITAWILNSFKFSLILYTFKVQTSFSSISTHSPSVFIASILTQGHVLWWHSASCLSVFFQKGFWEPVYWLQALHLHLAPSSQRSHDRVKVTPVLSSVPSISGGEEELPLALFCSCASLCVAYDKYTPSKFHSHFFLSIHLRSMNKHRLTD